MKFLSLLLAAGFLASFAGAETVHFDSVKPGALPEGWVAGVTGPGTAQWAVAADPAAPGAPRVLQQSGAVPSRSYPWCVKKDVSLQDGFVEVKFKPLSGQEDQAGGVVWRWQDGDNYYVARGNALEDNVILFRTIKGARKELHRCAVKVAPHQWHTLRVDFNGSHFTVTFDGRSVMEWDDETFKKPGAVGVWTKADSVTAFNDFQFEGH
jgi:hypothetical protein